MVDLVTPLVPPPGGSEQGHPHLHPRERALLDALHRQRRVIAAFPTTDHQLHRIRALADRLAESDLVDTLRRGVATAFELGVAPDPTLLIAATEEGGGDAVEVIPAPQLLLALLLDRLDDHPLVPLARGLAALARWSDPASASAVRRALALTEWQRDDFLALIPLAEWIYTEGLGLHLAEALQPTLEVHDLLGVSRTAAARLREQERLLMSLLEEELPLQASASWYRWLGEEGRAEARHPSGTRIPLGAGRYLAWRMTAERVARTGLAAALREEA